jgi:predicted dehydrogenase
MKVAIIGAGLIGRKRAINLPAGVNLVLVCDKDVEKAKQMTMDFNCKYELDWKKVVINPEIEAVFVATTHNWLAQIATEAIKNNKHVFLEKPGARNISEFEKIITAYKKNKVVVAFGYNHRYHPAIQKAKKLIESKEFGEIMFIRAKYGHGARLGYEKEWRFVEELSGGGELIDQGPHLIDLVNYLGCKMDEVVGYTGTMYWQTPLEDCAFFMMKNKKGQIAQLSVTCVEWKNIFSFEIMLKTAKIEIDGLGRSYGKEHLTLYKMKPEMGPPDIEEFEFEEDDLSWAKENKIFFDRIKNKDYSPTPLSEAKYVLEMIDRLYKLNKRK